MTIDGSSRGRGHVWLVLLAVLGAALVSVLALPQWDSPARADEREGPGQRITLERSADPAFQRELTEASTGGVREPYIVGGTPVPDGKYRFMAYLDITWRNGDNPTCGGTLIDPNSVLTAAHCLWGPQSSVTSVDVYVGAALPAQSQGRQLRHAINPVAFHPKYTPGKFSYDVAVLKLNQPVTGIKPINLNTSDNAGIALETPPRVLTVAGWGPTSPGGSITNRMNEVSLRVVSDASAQQAWSTGSTPYVPSIMVATESQVGKAPTQGDSGGPLFNPGATPTQVGIVSGGSGGTSAKPTAYTDINNPTEIRPFIVNAMAR
jgi:trypsin